MVPVALFYCINVFIALYSLDQLDVTLYGALKRVTILFTLAGEYFLLQKASSFYVQGSVLMIVFGAFVAVKYNSQGWTLFVGVVAAICSCLSQAIYLLLLSKSKKDLNVSVYEQMMYISLLSLPLLLLLVVFQDSLSGLFDNPNWGNNSFVVS